VTQPNAPTASAQRRPRAPRPSPALGRLIGRNPDYQTMSVILLAGVFVLVSGLLAVADSAQWGFSFGGAWDGVFSQLPVTGPAALLMAAATSINVVAGAVVLRWLGAPAFRSASDVVMAGFTAAVVLDAAVLFLLGSVGLFGWPELLALHLAVGVAYLATRGRRPLLAQPIRLHFSRPAAWWPLILMVWAGALIVQLGSPVSPFMDVLPNHVAPVQHIHLFGSFDMLNTSPSPIYGPSRLMLGYVALLGQLSTITGLDAALAEAAFALPLAIVIAVALRRLTGQLLGGSAGFWVLLTFPLTFTFMRIPDARGTVVVFPLAAWALTLVARELHARSQAVGSRSGVPDETSRVGSSPAVGPGLALAIGGAFLVHPLVGLVAAVACGGALLLYPVALARRLVPALGGAAVLAMPQVLTMTGRSTPSWIGFVLIVGGIAVAYLLAGAVGWLMDRIPADAFRDSSPEMAAVGRAAVVIAFISAALIVAQMHLNPPDDPASEALTDFGRITLLAIAGFAFSATRLHQRLGRGWILLGCGIAAGVLAWSASSLVGFTTLTEQAVHYEVPKSVEYWLPVMFAVGAAGALAAVCRQRRLGVARPLIVGAFIVITVYPLPARIDLGPLNIDAGRLVGAPLISNVQIGEHRGSESLGLALREAQFGYWTDGYMDPRNVVDADQQKVIDAIRSEITAGRLGPDTRVLHIAGSFQQWSSVPIGVFTGAMETSISLQPEVSIHTDGGRLYGFGDLPRELRSGYGYVVIEPHGLPDEIAVDSAAQVMAAGYHAIWSNSVATIYARS